MISCGFSAKKVDIVPHGIDPALYNCDKVELTEFTTCFHILFVGTPSRRKGLDIFLKSVRKAFPDGRDVRLTIKTSAWRPRIDMFTDWEKKVQSLREEGFEIQVITDDLSEQNMVSLYQSVDLLCSPHRGEGFGLAILESMACQTAVLTTGWSGPLDFLDAKTALLAQKHRLRPVQGLLPVHFIHDDPIVETDAEMVEPDCDEFAYFLRFAAQNRVHLSTLAAKGRLKAREFTWDKAANALAKTLLTAYASGGNEGETS